MSFDIRHLRHFLAATDMRSISRAADSLGVTQPAMSHSIRNLEEGLGTKLFNRLPGGLELTESGKRFEVHARSILRAVEQAHSDLRHLEQDPVGPVHLGLTIGLAELLTVPVIERVKSRYPGVFLTVTETASGLIIEQVKMGAIDLGVSFIPENELLPRKERIANDQYYLCGRTDQIEALGVSHVRACELEKYPLVMMSMQNGQRSLVETAVARQGGILNIVAEIDTALGLKRAMVAGLAFSAFPLPSLFPELGNKILSAIPIVEPEIRRPLYLASLPHAQQISSVRAVAEIVREMVYELRASGHWGSPLSDDEIADNHMLNTKTSLKRG